MVFSAKWWKDDLWIFHDEIDESCNTIEMSRSISCGPSQTHMGEYPHCEVSEEFDQLLA